MATRVGTKPKCWESFCLTEKLGYKGNSTSNVEIRLGNQAVELVQSAVSVPVFSQTPTRSVHAWENVGNVCQNGNFAESWQFSFGRQRRATYDGGTFWKERRGRRRSTLLCGVATAGHTQRYRLLCGGFGGGVQARDLRFVGVVARQKACDFVDDLARVWRLLRRL